MGYYKDGKRTDQYYSKSVVEGNENWFGRMITPRPASERICDGDKIYAYMNDEACHKKDYLESLDKSIDRERYILENTIVHGSFYEPKPMENDITQKCLNYIESEILSCHQHDELSDLPVLEHIKWLLETRQRWEAQILPRREANVIDKLPNSLKDRPASPQDAFQGPASMTDDQINRMIDNQRKTISKEHSLFVEHLLEKKYFGSAEKFMNLSPSDREKCSDYRTWLHYSKL